MNVYSPRMARQAWDALKIEIIESGWAQLGSDWNRAHVSPPYSRMYYIAQGGGSVTGGGETLPLEAGRVYLIPAGMSIRYACPRSMTQLYFHINARTIDGYDLFSKCARMLWLDAREEVSGLCEDYLSDDLTRMCLLKCRVEETLYRFVAAAGLEGALLTQHSPFLKKTFEAVRARLCSSLSIAQIARDMALSPSALAGRFRREFGMPLGRYIDEMLLAEIGRLLSGTGLTVGQIAERLGFCDQFYLSRFFSARMGMPPSEYRARLRSQL